MISLFIDTSSSDVSIAIIKDSELLSSRIKDIPGEHSVYATSLLDEVFKEAKIEKDDIDNVMVVTGPGSFTGLRIGVTIAKVFGYLVKKKVICISSLKMRALSFDHDYCLSLMDARNNNYYLALYDKNNKEIVEPVFGNKEMVKDLIEKYNPVCVGDNDFSVDDKKVLKKKLDVVRIFNYYKDKDKINPHLVVPDYLKLPQAMENKK